VKVVVDRSSTGTVESTVPESNVGEPHVFVALAWTWSAAMSFDRPPLSVKSHVRIGLVTPTTVPLGTSAWGCSGASVVEIVSCHVGWSDSKELSEMLAAVPAVRAIRTPYQAAPDAAACTSEVRSKVTGRPPRGARDHEGDVEPIGGHVAVVRDPSDQALVTALAAG
jgi:hypothetical protein